MFWGSNVPFAPRIVSVTRLLGHEGARLTEGFISCTISSWILILSPALPLGSHVDVNHGRVGGSKRPIGNIGESFATSDRLVHLEEDVPNLLHMMLDLLRVLHCVG